jgi:hypothetical protein
MAPDSATGKEGAMQGIRWETDFRAALANAKRSGLPIFQDFWFDG